MAKTSSSFVLPIIFLVMFALVEQNMGCMAVLGSCGVITDCSGACKSKFGQDTLSRCDRDGGAGTCICSYPCLTEKPHI
ncbi:PREDICTED: defensin-like protein 171 [Camelina sativa]|uniref:Defensin-like protein n=1 Tax=Camelina sativa TaxID=90675 RepID=A0ABM1RPS5_CAMSA|nr:PREDICTED: defensin-like protein 171 [Camelina sativa]